VVIREREDRELLQLEVFLRHADEAVLADAILLKLPSEPDEDRTAQLEVVNCSHPGRFALALSMTASFGSTAISPTALATVPELLRQLRRIRHGKSSAS
jgi:hypothetical protein